MIDFDPDKDNPYYEDPDDSVCYYCGAPLPLAPVKDTFPWYGFCDADCMDRQIRAMIESGY